MIASNNSGLVSPILIGRASALSTLTQLMEQARAGQGSTVILSGEAGIGKTRLAGEARVVAARHNMLLLDGHCFEPDHGLPFAPLSDLLQRFVAASADRGQGLLRDADTAALAALLPELSPSVPVQSPGRPFPAEVERRRLFQALAQVLLNSERAGPRLIVIEDLHWSDEASLAFLLFFARRITAEPVLLLLTYRNDEAPLRLAQFLAALDRERLATELVLDRLRPAEVDQLLRAVFPLAQPPRPDFLAALYRLTDGNIFFIEEVLRSLAAAGGLERDQRGWDHTLLESLQIPRTVRVAVQQRAERLSPAARAVLELAAVSGRRFDFALLRALSGMTEEELLQHMKTLVAAHLLVEISADQFAFCHALMREAIYATLLKRELKRQHAIVAETLERLYAATPQLELFLGDLAYHYLQAGNWDKAGQYATRAGERAQRLFAPHEAIEHFTQAAQAAHELGQSPDRSLRRARGQAYETVGDFENAAGDYEHNLSTAQSASDLRAEWQAQLDLGLLWAARDYDRSGQHLQAALALARSLGDQMVVARSLNRLGNQQLNVDQPLEALAHHREALAIFQAAGDLAGLAETYDLMGMASCLSGDLRAGTEFYGQAVTLFRDLDDRQGLVSSLASLSMSGLTYQTSTLVAAAPLAAVTQQVQAALTLAHSINQRSGEAYALIFLSFCQGAAGDYGLALEAALAGLGLAESIQHRQWQAAAHCALAVLYWDLLVLPEAARQAQAALVLAQTSASRHWINCAAGYLASIQVDSGQLELAAATLAGVIATHGAAQTLGQRLVQAAQAELALVQGRAELAITLVDQLCASAPNWPSAGQGAIPRLALVRAAALGQLNRWPEAAAELEAARRVAAAAGARGWLWRIDWQLARVYQPTGQLAESVSRADSARTLLTELAGGLDDTGQRAGLEQAAAALAPAGRPATPRQRAATAFGGLTPREREVAGLIAQGKSNREAAAALVVSERTIETHVANILGKLGLNSRTQIAAWAIERGLHTPP